MIRLLAISFLSIMASCRPSVNESQPEKGILQFHLNDSVQSTAYFRWSDEDSSVCWIGNPDEEFRFRLDSANPRRLNHPFLPSYFTFQDNFLTGGYFHQPERSPDYKVLVTTQRSPWPTDLLPTKERQYYLSFGEGGDAYPGILLLQLNKDYRAAGSVRTETGDYRYLYGMQNGDSLHLSAFDGSHLFQFEFKLVDGQSAIQGRFYSGNHWSTTITGNVHDTVQLRTEEDLTEGTDQPVGLTMYELNSPDSVSLSDQSGPMVLQLFGSWCPNCYDETRLLSEYSDEFPNVSFVGVAFERSADIATQKSRVRRYVKHLNVPYKVYLGGTANKQRIAEKLFWLSHFVSYPTLVFLDKDLRIVAVHTGFNGPATGTQFLETQRKIRHELENLSEEK